MSIQAKSATAPSVCPSTTERGMNGLWIDHRLRTPAPPALVRRAVATANIASCLSTSDAVSSSDTGKLSKAGGLHFIFVTEEAIERTCTFWARPDLNLPLEPTVAPMERALTGRNEPDPIVDAGPNASLSKATCKKRAAYTRQKDNF